MFGNNFGNVSFSTQVCEQAFIGRSDKKYCSDQCQASENNRKKKAGAGERMILGINRILRKNRSILKS